MELPAGDHPLTLACQGNGCIQVDRFTVDVTNCDVIKLPDELVPDPEKVKPKSKIDRIRHLKVPSSR